MPAYSCVSLANAVLSCQAKPILADINRNLTIDINSVIDKITNRTKAIIVVHTFGSHSDIPSGLMTTNLRRTIPVIEDMAHGVFRQQAKIAVSSFAPTKLIGSIGGGIVSGSKYYMDKIKDLRCCEDKAPSIKQNDLPNDVMSAVAVEQLKRLDEILLKRNEAADNYDVFDDLPAEIVPVCYGQYRFTIRLKNHLAADISKAMQEKGIYCEQPVWDYRYAPDNDLMAVDPNYINHWEDLPNTDEAFDKILSIPFWETITPEEQETVVRVLGECLK